MSLGGPNNQLTPAPPWTHRRMLVSHEQGPPVVDRPGRHGGWAPRRRPVSLVPTTALWGLGARTRTGALCHRELGSGRALHRLPATTGLLLGSAPTWRKRAQEEASCVAHFFTPPTFTFCRWPLRESKVVGGSRLFTNPTAHFPSTRELLSQKSNDSTRHTRNKHHDGAECPPPESV